MDYISAEGRQGKVFVARFKPGQDLRDALNAFCLEKGIKAGYIPVLLGGFKNLKVNAMVQGEKDDQPRTVLREYQEPLEYFGCGTVAFADGKPSIHIHLAAAQGNHNAVGGHLVSGEIVFLTEVVIVEVEGIVMTRQSDPKVFNMPLLHFPH